MRWQPQEGLACLSMRMVRLVRSGSLLPLGPPRGWSMRPAGPCVSNFFFQAYRVCLDSPTNAAKSPAGRPLRRQVSSNSNRCCAVNGTVGAAGWTSRRPRRRPARPARAKALGRSPGSAAAGSAARVSGASGAGGAPGSWGSPGGGAAGSAAPGLWTVAAGPSAASGAAGRGGLLEAGQKNSNIRPPFPRTKSAPGEEGIPLQN